MGEKKKITVFRVFQAAQCGSAKYVLGVLCSAVSILCTAVPFYTVYRIVRIFLEASLHQTSVDSSQAWFWAVSYTHLTVKFMTRTANGGMRQPVFKGLREDKRPEECIDTSK